MSTDPGTTPGPEEAPKAPASAKTDLVEEASPSSPVEGEVPVQSDLEVTPLLSPPVLGDPSPPPLGPAKSDAAEKPESSEEESATNLAYEDMLAKLAAATQAPAPEPETPTVETPASMSESDAEPTPTSPTPSMTPSGLNILATVPIRRIKPVNPNPLLAEDDDPTIPGRRAAAKAQPMSVREARLAHPEPLLPVQASARSRLIHLVLGGVLVVGGMFLAVVVLRLLMPRPVPQPAAATAPSPPPPPAYAPPIQVEPLPASTASAGIPALPTAPVPTAAGEKPADTRELSGLAPAQPQRSPRKAGARSKPTRPNAALAAAAPAQAPAAELATAPKAPPAAAPPEKEGTPPTGRKGGKSSAYVDPFE